MSRIRASQRLTVGAAALAVTLGGLALITTSAKAANSNDYELLASASAFDITLRDNSLPATQIIQASPFGASAALSSSGVAKSDAGAPYAPFGYSLPSTATGVGAGLLPSIPPFPGYVSASHPVSPRSSQATGGYALEATASDTAARGEVKLGSQPAGSPTANGYALAESIANNDGSVTVSGSSGASAFSFGGVLDLGRVDSTLSMAIPTSGKPVISGGTDLGTVTFASSFVNGIKGPHTFVAGQPTPITPAMLAELNPLLEPYGLNFSYLPQTFGYTDDTGSQGPAPDPKKTVRSVISGGLLITSTQKIPTQGQVDTRYTLGQVSLSATNIARSELAGGTQGATGVDGGGALPTTTDAAGSSGLDAAGAGSLPGLEMGAQPTTDSVPTVALTPQTGAVAFIGDRATSSESFYLMLVLAPRSEQPRSSGSARSSHERGTDADAQPPIDLAPRTRRRRDHGARGAPGDLGLRIASRLRGVRGRQFSRHRGR